MKNMVKLHFYNLIKTIVKITIKNIITRKKIFGTNSFLYYEISQHIGFIFSREILYENKLQSKIKNYINETSLIFDVGSNIGQYALWFSNIASQGKIVCFEPDSKNYAFLTFNVSINRCLNVETSNVGISNSISRQKLYCDTQNGGRCSSLGKEFVGNSFEGFTQDINTSTLDLQIQKYGIPDFVKIDVEGCEYAVIEGLKSPPQKTVFFIEVRNATSSKIFDFFKRHNFICKLLDCDPSIDILESSQIPEFCNLLFVYKYK